MTPDREELRRLLVEATPGPWATDWLEILTGSDDPADGVSFLHRIYRHGERGDEGAIAELSELRCQRAPPPDAVLIVLAVNALPDLLDRLDELEAEVARLRGEEAPR